MIISILVWSVGFVIPLIMQDNNIADFTQDFRNSRDEFMEFKQILVNNLNAAFSILIFGFFTLGIYSVLMIFLNGFVLGIHVDYALNSVNIPLGIILKSILPHFLEYVALWISMALSLYGIIIIHRLCKSEPGMLTGDEVRLLIHASLIILLFITMAAFIEVKISLPVILQD